MQKIIAERRGAAVDSATREATTAATQAYNAMAAQRAYTGIMQFGNMCMM